jgi:nucleotide-binding universal stress UspA family protein
MMKTILVCYEERPVAQRVLARAAELAKALDAHVIVTSVAPALHVVRGGGPVDPVDPPARHEEEVAQAVKTLAELGLTSVDTVIGLGDVSDTIVALAEEREADLIVLGAHDGGVISRLLGTSTTDAVAHKAPTDVLIVH